MFVLGGSFGSMSSTEGRLPEAEDCGIRMQVAVPDSPAAEVGLVFGTAAE